MTAPGRRIRAATFLSLLALLVAAGASAAARAPKGSLTLLRGSEACLGPGHGCGHLRGPTGLLRLAISPDARTLYATGQAGGLAILDRDPRTGHVHQLPGSRGCFRRDGAQGCRRLTGLIGPGAIAVSPDGRHLYVTTAVGIQAFARTRAGALAPIVCPGCVGLRAPGAPTALLAAGNRTIYASGPYTDAHGNHTGALAVLTRDPRSGALRQALGAAGCLDDDASHTCSLAPCVDEITALALARDGRHLYTAATNSLDPQATEPGDVATFARNRFTGTLTWIGCHTRWAAIADILTLPRSAAVLVATLFGNRGTARVGGSLDLYRPGAGDVLARVRKLACVRHAPCPIPYYTGSARLAGTPSGDTVYVGMTFGGITVLRHGARGVVQLAGHAGCIVSATHFTPPHGCAYEGAEIGADLVVSPDGRDLYVATLGPSHTQYYSGGLETFRISR